MQPMSGDNEDMEAFLAEIELVHDKVSKLQRGEITIEEFDRQEARREARKKREEDEGREKERQAFERRKQGREGKGEKKDYIHFCKGCFLEFELPTMSCPRCKRPTMSQEQRYNELMVKVQDYKERKSRKEEHRQKWELWDKTQKILWKHQVNYKKWEYFTSDSEEDEHPEPILPKNDPNFIALEQDMKERKKRKEEASKSAEQLKLKGNEYIKNKQFDHAVMKYSQALELVKDNKAIWLNRALAYLKLQKYRKCISDCSRVIEYAECFENGFTQSRESCFKAFLRRGKAYKERKEYEPGMKDADQAIQLCPNDTEALQLRKDIELLVEHQEKVLKSEIDQVNSNYREIINSFVAKPPNEIRNTDLMGLLKQIRKSPEQAKVYFFEKKAITKLMTTIELSIDDEATHTENLTAHLPPLVIQVYLDNNALYKEHFIKAPLGMNVVLKKIESLLRKADGKIKSALYDTVEDYLEILDCIVEEEKTRNLMQKDETLVGYLYPTFWKAITSLYVSEPAMTTTFITLCSNLCFGPSLLKQRLETVYVEVIASLAPILEISPSKVKYLPLLTSISNLLSNFLSETTFRQHLIQDKTLHDQLFRRLLDQIKQVEVNENARTLKWTESALAVFVNLSYQAKEETQRLFCDMNVGELFIKKFVQQDCPAKTAVSRALQVLSKINYTFDQRLLNLNSTSLLYSLSRFLQADLQTRENEFTSHSLRLIMQMFTTVDMSGKELLRQELLTQPESLSSLLTLLKQLLFSEVELIFCNACNAIGYIIDTSPLQPNMNGSNPSSFFHQVIPRLITVVRDRTGNTRKNAAILLAKLTKEERNLQTLRDLHGIEILHSVYSHIMQK